MLNPIWLKTFTTVAACHSFTEAGRQLDLTQSSVSEHIRRLEQSVGRRLFVRDTHSLAVTPDGEAMLAHATVIATLPCGGSLEQSIVRRAAGVSEGGFGKEQ